MIPPTGPRLAALAQQVLETPPPGGISVRDLAMTLALAWAAAKVRGGRGGDR